jgi:uncharacterized protein
MTIRGFEKLLVRGSRFGGRLQAPARDRPCPAAGTADGLGAPAIFAAVTGIAAGFFSALFGVGGAVMIVPFLILVCKLPVRLAMGTALAAILLTAIFGTVVFARAGAVDWAHAPLVGFPAVAGVVIGTWLQRRIQPAALLLLYASLAVGISIKLLLG